MVKGRGLKYEATFPYKRPSDGEIIWIHSIANVIRDENGKPLYIYGVAQDITERYLAKLGIEQRAELLRIMHDVAASSNEAYEVDEYLEQVLERVCQGRNWPIGHVYKRDDSIEDLLVPTAIWHVEKESRFEQFQQESETTTFMSGIGLPGRSWKAASRY